MNKSYKVLTLIMLALLIGTNFYTTSLITKNQQQQIRKGEDQIAQMEAQITELENQNQRLQELDKKIENQNSLIKAVAEFSGIQTHLQIVDAVVDGQMSTFRSPQYYRAVEAKAAESAVDEIWEEIRGRKFSSVMFTLPNGQN